MANQLELRDKQHIIPDPGAHANIGPGFDYGSVTDKIAGIVYLPFNKSPKKLAGWRFHSVLPGERSPVLRLDAVRAWHRYLGYQYPNRVGFCHHQLRLVDWYWARWNADLRCLIPPQTGLAHRY